MSGLQRLKFENKPKISLVSANEIEGKPSYGKPQHIRLLAMKNSAIVDCLNVIDALNPTLIGCQDVPSCNGLDTRATR